jgi:hypothetical protein
MNWHVSSARERVSVPAEWLSFAIGPVFVASAWAVTTYVRGLGDIGFGGTNVIIVGIFGVILLTAGIQYLVRPCALRTIPLHGYLLVYFAALLGGFKVMASPVTQVELRFLAETLLITTVPLGVAVLSARRKAPATLALVLGLAGGVAALMVLYFVLTNGPIVRRLDVRAALGIGLARNQLGHGFALSTVAAVFLAMEGRRGLQSTAWWGLAALCLAAVVGTGSRSSVLGALSGASVLLVTGMARQRVQQRVLLPLGLFALAAAVAWLAVAGADELLLRRFTPDMVGAAFEGRASLLTGSVRSMLDHSRWWELITGMSAAYYLPFRDVTAPYSLPDPHNVIVSALVFWGPLVSLLLLGTLFFSVRDAVRLGLRYRTRDHWLLLALLLPSLIYSMSSGRLTRAFSIWVVIGVIWGQVYLVRTRSLMSVMVPAAEEPEMDVVVTGVDQRQSSAGQG